MTHLEQTLATGEKILNRATVSNAYVFVRSGLPLLVGGLAGLVLWHASTAAEPDDADVDRAFAIVSFSCAVAVALWMLGSGLFMKATTEVALTNRRVILKWGILNRRTVDIYLDKVEGIADQQDVFGRCFGYGSIAVRGTGGGSTPCPGIAAPHEFCRTVNDHIQRGSATVA